MTDEEIDAMEAGREMDVAMHRSLYPRHNIETFTNLDLALWHYCDGSHEKSSSCQWQMVPFYSTDIAAAWQVVEKLIANDAAPHLVYDGDDWIMGEKYWDQEWDEHSYGKTAPLAICRHALKCCKSVADKKEDARWDALSNYPNR